MAEDMIGYFVDTFMKQAIPDASDEELRAIAAKNLEQQYLDETLSLYASAMILDARGFTERLTVPLAYFFAKDGVLIPPSVNEWLAQRVKDFESHPFPSSSHTFFQESEHREQFLRELTAFLRRA